MCFPLAIGLAGGAGKKNHFSKRKKKVFFLEKKRKKTPHEPRTPPALDTDREGSKDK
jgi:hypothetical protein